MRRKSTGTNGRGDPVLVSQTSVTDDVRFGTGVNCRDEDGESWRAFNSVSSFWASAIALKSTCVGSWVSTPARVARESASAA